MRKRNHLSRFEALARQLVEGSFSRLFGGRLVPTEIATRLAHALEDSQQSGQPANYYLVHLHPADYAELLDENPGLEMRLADYLLQLTQQAGLALRGAPAVELAPDASLGRQRVLVEAGQHSDEEEDETRARRIDPAALALEALERADAFLIVEGKHHVSLNRPVTTIGRQTDNDIVLDAPAVSRHHAQIRWRYGRFVIYDLGSRGGTMVNDQLVTESVLRPGDVITLSTVPLIYGEGAAEKDAGARPGPAYKGDETVPLRRENGA
ncbi:MAG: FHA domain-containing protein [Chloroflexi bacterium]|nr:FHA domain-containing protein [Chloroflexota bacterium]MCI0578594.1 FHA domain-containing protein [Chloroflexota bacterium]MCI0647353.1 FHA domain-containing protein [Chloroflexota bacterium]MCI0727813.1 FHA domain-containing protein [Chloroflexota bacterium]